MRGGYLLIVALIFSIYIHNSMAMGEPDTLSHASMKFLSSFSFKEPFFPDAGSSAVPGWEVRGSTVVMTDYIRLTPAENGRSGHITNRRPFFLNSLNLTLGFHIHSDAKQGADGMALWLTDAPVKSGICLGGQETWNGLGVFFDTFSNSGRANVPQIAVHGNDGTRAFDPNSDGDSTVLARCNSDYRNADISYLNLIYEDGFLNIKVDARGNGQWVQCASNIEYKLPARFFFSLSAATGGLFDNHDLKFLSVNTMDMKSAIKRPPMASPSPVLSPEEVQKFIENLPVEHQPQFEEPEEEPLSKEEIKKEIKKMFPANEMEPELGDDDEDIMDKVNEIKDNFGHQLFELQNSFRDQIALMKGQIPGTIRLYQQLRDEIKQIDQLLSKTLTNSAILHKELLTVAMDSNPVLRIASLANSLEAHVRKIEGRIETLREVVQQVQNDHQNRRLEYNNTQQDSGSVIPALIFLIMAVTVICGGGFCCIKLLFSPKKRKTAL